MTINELKKLLKIKREVRAERDYYYYIEGNESTLHKIEEKLLNCEYIYEVQKEFFTNGFGRICFKVK